MWCVDLNVPGAQPHEFGHFLSQDVDHVRKKVIERRIGLYRPLGRPEVGKQARTGKGDLRYPGRSRLQIREFVNRQVAFAPQLSCLGYHFSWN